MPVNQRGYLGPQVVLPFLRLQSLEATATVRGHRHAEGSVGPGGQLGGESHGHGAALGVLAPTHHQVRTGA